MKQFTTSYAFTQIFDDNIPKIEEFATTILKDPEAAKFTAGIAFHW